MNTGSIWNTVEYRRIPPLLGATSSTFHFRFEKTKGIPKGISQNAHTTPTTHKLAMSSKKEPARVRADPKGIPKRTGPV